MENIFNYKNYAFCLGKIKDSKKKLTIPHFDISKIKKKPDENFYDVLINNDNKIKYFNKIITKIKRKTIKELVYANKNIPAKWKKEKGYNNLIVQLLSQDNQFLSYLGNSPKNENINNRNKKNRPKTSTYSAFNNNISIRNSFFETNDPLSRYKSNSSRLKKENKKLIKSKSLNNFDVLRNNSSFNIFMDNFKDNKNEVKNKFSKNGKNFDLFSFDKIKGNYFKNKGRILHNESPEKNNEIKKNIINYNNNLLMKLQALQFKQRLINLRRNIYSNLVLSFSQRSKTAKSRNVLKSNSNNNDGSNKRKIKNNILINSFTKRINNQKKNNSQYIPGNKNIIKFDNLVQLKKVLIK